MDTKYSTLELEKRVKETVIENESAWSVRKEMAATIWGRLCQCDGDGQRKGLGVMQQMNTRNSALEDGEGR